VAFADYNFTTPRVDLNVELESGAPGEVFDYPGVYQDRDGGDRLARVRLEEHEAKLKTVAGTSACDGFRCGHTFSLSNHSSALDKQYTLLSVEHQAKNQGYRAAAGAGSGKYSNRFEAMLATTQYRPARRARKALVHGTQTAVVTGPDGEEIYVDEYGRIQVRFFWSGEEHSCWVRVAQTWAGKNWGTAYWPRVGQEVVVDFLEGDPDRPLVIGSVYNADQMPPFALPANKTKSGVRSRSSQGGGASQCNEIHFEDKTGQEKLFIQAERDQEITVKHDRTVQIANDEVIRVGHNRTSNINTTDSITAGTNVTISAGQEIKLSSPGGSITIGPSGITIQSPGVIVIQGSMVKIN
jgi:type VI secretion system secreted protein VgrG